MMIRAYTFVNSHIVGDVTSINAKMNSINVGKGIDSQASKVPSKKMRSGDPTKKLNERLRIAPLSQYGMEPDIFLSLLLL